MNARNDHRKLVKHDDTLGEAHELTFSCYHRMPLLVSNPRCRLLAESVDAAIDRHGYELLAYVFMPEHVHLLVLPGTNAGGTSKLLYAIKKPFSYRIKRLMAEKNDPMLGVLTIRDRPHSASFRFWQEGPGYDRNVRNERTMRLSIDYIHQNPVRRGLVDHPDKWLWSSWRQYAEDCPQGGPNVNVWG